MNLRTLPEEDPKLTNKILNLELTYFYTMLKTVRHSIDLGYNTLEVNEKIKEIIPHILIPLTFKKGESKFDKKILKTYQLDSWIIDFLGEALFYCDN